jgi:2-isopropylmalate synthase
MYSQGVHPGLELSDLPAVVSDVEFCNQLPVHARHPYAGELVFTAFSGSHQDAIKKGFALQASDGLWRVPYLPLDPKDIGRTYEAIIRVNSQSGKGGVAFVLEQDYGIKLPRKVQIEFSRIIQKMTDETGKEIASYAIWKAFRAEYIDQKSPFACCQYTESSSSESGRITAILKGNGAEHLVNADGSGPIDAFVAAINAEFGVDLRIIDYQEGAVEGGSDAQAIAFVEVQFGPSQPVFGVGMNRNIVTASFDAIVSAINRGLRLGEVTLKSSPANSLTSAAIPA